MKTTFKKFAAVLSLVLIGTLLTAKASAECGYYPPSQKGGAVVSPQSWNRGEFTACWPSIKNASLSAGRIMPAAASKAR